MQWTERLFDTRAVAGAEAPDRPVVPDRPDRLAGVAERVRPLTLARERTLPVLAPLAPLLPETGLPRGAMVAVGGPGAMSVAFALAAAPTAAGSWVALVGLPGAGLAAAAELGLALGRVAVIDPPDPGAWPGVVAALLGAFDLVLVAPGHRISPTTARRLTARARERGSVLLTVSSPVGAGSLPGQRGVGAGSWPEAPELRLGVVAARWSGLGAGHGHLRARRLVVEATGRRSFARPRRVELLLPASDGSVRCIPEEAQAVPGVVAPLVREVG